MKSATRISLEAKLYPLFQRLQPGIVLDVGAKNSPYKTKVSHSKWMTLDINPETGADIIADIHEVPWESEYFDTFIATEVLEHCYCPEKAVNEIHRLLKKGGVCIASTRFIHPYHPDPYDYYRFTADGLKYLFREFDVAEIIPHGNIFQSIWMLLTSRRYVCTILEVFNPLIGRIEIQGVRTYCPCGYVVFARK